MENNSRDMVPDGESKMQKLDYADDSLLHPEHFTKSVIANNVQVIKMEKWQQKETHLIKENNTNGTMKIDEKFEHLELANVNSSLLVTKTKPIVKYDLSREPKDEFICDSKQDIKREIISDDLNEDIKDFKHMETRLDKIPKEILNKYGIVIEDCDSWKGPSVLEEKINVKGENEDENDDDDDDNEEEGRLVIDEDVSLNSYDDKCELSEIKTDVSSSAKENTAGFTNYGHHLVISSVKSLQWKAVCNICKISFSDEDLLKTHKKGHCSYPGCFDIIPDETEREKHLLIHKANPTKPFRCDHCKKRFHYYQFTKKHREICNLLEKLKCPYCNYASPKINYLNKHIARHVNKMYCNECQKMYVRVKKYVRHMFVYHGKEIWFQCPQCPERFQQPECIRKHIEIHQLNVSKSGIADFIQIQPIIPLKN